MASGPSTNFRIELDDRRHRHADTWDMPGKSMNVIDVSVMDEIEAITAEIASNAAIKGAVITSGKEAFSGGADLNMLQTLLASFAPGARRADAAKRR